MSEPQYNMDEVPKCKPGMVDSVVQYVSQRAEW